MSFPFKFLEDLPLFLARHARAHNPQDVIFPFSVGNYDHPTPDGSDGDEPIFLLRMLLVIDLEIVNVGLEKLASFLEGQAVLARFALSLAGSHSKRMAHREYTPLTD